jgi:hypothetical protein
MARWAKNKNMNPFTRKENLTSNKTIL